MGLKSFEQKSGSIGTHSKKSSSAKVYITRIASQYVPGSCENNILKDYIA